MECLLHKIFETCPFEIIGRLWGGLSIIRVVGTSQPSSLLQGVLDFWL